MEVRALIDAIPSGCFISSSQSVVSAPQACTLDVTGWKVGTPATSAPNVIQSFVYFGGNLVKAPMMYAKMMSDHWKGLHRVEFKRKPVGMLDTVMEGVVIDDIGIVSR